MVGVRVPTSTVVTAATNLERFEAPYDVSVSLCFECGFTVAMAVVRSNGVRPEITVGTPKVPTVLVPAGITRLATVKPNIV